MVGRLFGSPLSGHQGGMSSSPAPQPLHTPTSQSSPSTSRRERIEQARQDRSRRRNFGFLKTGSSSSGGNNNMERKVMSTTALTRRREHAKQLANLAYSEDPSSSSSAAAAAAAAKHDKITPTSRSAQQQLLSAFDFDSPQNATTRAPLDPFSSMGRSTGSSSTSRRQTSRSNNPLFSDPHNVMLTSSAGAVTDREPTASTVDTFDNSSLGSAAFDMDFLSSSVTNNHHNPPTNAGRGVAAAATTTTTTTNRPSGHRQYQSNNKTTLDNFFVESHERNMPSTTSSMMPSRYQQPQSNAGNGAAVSGGSSVHSAQTNNSGSMGAAARRRMRSHMKSQNGGSSGNTSVAGGGSVESSSFVSSPAPDSPATSHSFRRGNHHRSASKNRVAAYSGAGSSFHHQRSPSFVSTGGTSVTSSNNSASSPGIFDSTNMDGGFTFDAFGLDQSQVEREVNQAMQDLAGEGISGFSMMVDRPTSSKKEGSSGHRRGDSLAQQSDDDTFAAPNWDSSPNTSRNASPVPPNYHTNSDANESYVDGFRVKPFSRHSHQTGRTSTKTSPFSSPVVSSAARRKFQPGSSGEASNPVRNLPQRQNDPALEQLQTPPRWPSSRQPAHSTPSPSGLQNNQSPRVSVFQDPVVDNPWKEDPWASDDGKGGNNSDCFSTIDTQSDVQDYRGSYGSFGGEGRLSSRSYAKSEVGVASPSTFGSPTFYELPPEEPRPSVGSPEDDSETDSDESEAISQMQEDMTREFAMDFVRRVSPTNRNYRSETPKVKSPQNPGLVVNAENESENENQEVSIRSRHSYRSRLFRESQRRSRDAPRPSPSTAISNAVPVNPSTTYKSTDTAAVANETHSGSKDSRFSNFRSKYELRTRGRVGESAEVAKSAPSSKLSESVDFSQTTAVAEYGAESLNNASNPETGGSPPIDSKTPMVSTKPIGRRILSTRDTENSDNAEEKKDEEEPHHAVVSPAAKVGSLKARWEEKTKSSHPATKSTVAPSKEHIPSSGKARERIGKMDNAFEMLTPAIVEARRQEKQKSRSLHLRKSMGVSDSPDLSSPKISSAHQRKSVGESDSPKFSSSKSEVGTNHGSTVADRILNNVRRASPREYSTSIGKHDETKSDGGSTPSFLANVKLRKVTNAPVSWRATNTNEGTHSMSPFDEGRHEDMTENYDEDEDVDTSESVGRPIERKLTYRERREMELQQAKEKTEALDDNSQVAVKKDVASLIRKRIAANKQRNVSGQQESNSEDFLGGRPKTSKDVDSYHVNKSPAGGTKHAATQSPNYISTLPASPHHGVASFNQSLSQSSPLAKPSPGSSSADKAWSAKSDFSSSPIRSQAGKLQQYLNKSTAQEHVEAPYPANSSAALPVSPPVPDVRRKSDVPDDISQADVKSMLSSFLGSRAPPALPLPAREDDTEALKKHLVKSPTKNSSPKPIEESPPPPPPPTYDPSGKRPALKDDPKFERYFRMLRMGLPLEVAKHAMERDGLDPTVLDLDHDKPVGIPLKEDPKFEKYFKMLKIGISMEQVKHSMESDGLNPSIMDQDHNLPVMAVEKRQEKKQKETHRRARLHWKTIGNVVRNSLWAKVETEVTAIDIDEEEFNELFKADLKGESNGNRNVSNQKKKGAAVRVIDAKRANNGGIILARLKMTHDEMADAVDRIDSDVLTAEQIENIIEYLPTKEEREALEKYMLEGGQDAAEKFDGLCECEKFMVSMMTVKHAKRKIRALLFKLQFMSCMESIAEDAQIIDNACDELSHSNRLRQLFGIILQFGNRLNTAGVNSKGKAGAFTLDSLLKLKQAKAFDKKTTFLHYIILIVQRNNEVLLTYYDDIPTVLKADKVFWDQCLQDLEEVENQLENVRRISLYEAKMRKQYKLKKPNDDNSDDDSLGDMELSLEEEVESLRATSSGIFTLGAIKQVSALRDKIDRTKSKFSRLLEYFGEDARKMQPHELFNTIAAFTRDFQKAKEEVFSTNQKRLREDRKNARNKTPVQKNGLPPPGPDGAPKSMLRASDHQPNMSSIVSELQQRQRGPFSPISPRQGHVNGEGSVTSSTAGPSNIGLASQRVPSKLDNHTLSSLPPQAISRSPRDAVRNRRRMEAMRERNGQV